ncbi:MAG: SGNH/GDSL hydrolase family protein, partial [Blastocatellia bacterium]
MVRSLIRTVLALVLVIALKIAGLVLDRKSPGTAGYHQNILHSLQLLALGWLLISFVAEFRLRYTPGWRRTEALTWIILLLCGGVAEGLCTGWLRYPLGIPARLKTSFRQYYQSHYRNILQADPDCAEYDSELFYRLRPGVRCGFGNPEFATRVNTNSAGLRDDETSLTQPEIICLGDSYTQGWGVEQNDAFPQQLEKLAGRRVLNAGMSSYGTARELKLFQRLDGSRSDWVVLQYSDNDQFENKAYVDAGNTLKTSPLAAFEAMTSAQALNHRYYPGKHFLSILFSAQGELMKSFARENIAQISAGGL